MDNQFTLDQQLLTYFIMAFIIATLVISSVRATIKSSKSNKNTVKKPKGGERVWVK